MCLVVTVSFVLLLTLSLSSSESLNSNNTNITLEKREMSKILLPVDFHANVDFHYPNTGDLFHFTENSYNGMRQASVLNMFVGGLGQILGFSSAITDIANLFGIFLGGATKYTIDDVMNQLNTQFADVKNQLAVIYSKMQKQDIDAYRAVEDAVTAANSDIMLNSTLDLTSRGLRLSDQLFIFSRGLLGQNGFSADILQVTTDLLKCASTSIYNRMQKYINLVNIGSLGLAFYGSRIGNSFNVNARANTLGDMKSQILTRTNTFMTNCQTFTVDKIHGYINTTLSSMQSSSAWNIAQALYSYLDDVYNQKINFLFYVAKDFDERNTVKFGYWGGGLQSNVTNGVWKVYWAATPISPVQDVQWLQVDSGRLSNILLTDPVKSVAPRNADFIYKNIPNSVSSGRKTCLFLVVLYYYWAPVSPASVGSPFRLNTWNFRFSANWPVPNSFRGGLGTWVVDIIIQ